MLLPPAEKEHLPLPPIDLIQDRFNATKNLIELDKALTHALPVLSPMAAAIEEVGDIVPSGSESLFADIGHCVCGMNKCGVRNFLVIIFHLSLEILIQSGFSFFLLSYFKIRGKQPGSISFSYHWWSEYTIRLQLRWPYPCEKKEVIINFKDPETVLLSIGDKDGIRKEEDISRAEVEGRIKKVLGEIVED